MTNVNQMNGADAIEAKKCLDAKGGCGFALAPLEAEDCDLNLSAGAWGWCDAPIGAHALWHARVPVHECVPHLEGR
jgi:hypothetical protein